MAAESGDVRMVLMIWWFIGHARARQRGIKGGGQGLGEGEGGCSSLEGNGVVVAMIGALLGGSGDSSLLLLLSSTAAPPPPSFLLTRRAPKPYQVVRNQGGKIHQPSLVQAPLLPLSPPERDLDKDAACSFASSVSISLRTMSSFPPPHSPPFPSLSDG